MTATSSPAHIALTTGGPSHGPSRAWGASLRTFTLWARLVGWITLLVLTTMLLWWPVSPSPDDPLPVQSLGAIDHLPLFSVAFYAWVAVVVTLIFTGCRTVLQGLVLGTSFTLVFVQFWGFMSPMGNSGDSAWLVGHVKHLLEHGHISAGGTTPFRYFDFPGLSLVGAAVAALTGLGPFEAARFYVLASGPLLVTVLYAAYLRLTQRPVLAAAAVVLCVASNLGLGMIPNQFHPINLATMYIAAFLLLLTTRGGPEDRNMQKLMLLLLVAAAIEYVFTPVLMATVLAAFYFLKRWQGENVNISFLTVLLPVVLLAMWVVFWTFWTSRNLLAELPRVLDDFTTWAWLLPTAQALFGHVGQQAPWWGTAGRFFWWTTVYGIGSLILLGLVLSAVRRAAPSARRIEVAFFVGVLATVIVGAFAVQGLVHGSLSRYVWVGNLVIAPTLVVLLARARALFPAVLYVAAAGLVALPTFLSNAHSLSFSRIYRHQLVPTELIAASFPDGEGLTLYFGDSSIDPVYIPRSGFPGGQSLVGMGVREDTIWSHNRTWVEEFRAQPPDTTLLVDSPSGKLRASERLGIPLDDPRWGEAAERLNAAGNRIYDNGTRQLYSPSGRSAASP